MVAIDSAILICARLLRAGAVPRAELPDLAFPEVTADAAFDAASNLGLRSDACALLVILWARLVLQKRTVADTRELPGQGEMFTGERTATARGFRPRPRLGGVVRA